MTSKGNELVPVIQACPFCGEALNERHSVNPSARCGTEGCWLNARMIGIPLDDPAQVAAFNTRTSSTAELLEALERMIQAELSGLGANMAKARHHARDVIASAKGGEA